MAHYRRATPRAWQNPAMTLRLPAQAVLLLFALLCAAVANAQPTDRMLVFSKTAKFRHDAIPVAVAALQRVAAQEGLLADHSEDADAFTAANLARYRVVVFASTTGDVLDDAQQAAMEGFIRGGGGFVGVHAAADTEYDWPWYGKLVGAWFRSHPPGLQTTRVHFVQDGIAVQGREWQVTDEIYNYRDNPRGRVRVLATVEEADYAGGTMGADHPIAWCHESRRGRAWYTGLGHDAKLYADPVFLRQLARGLRYVTRLSEDC